MAINNQNTTSDIPTQINADNLYGLNNANTGCLSGSCPQNTLTNLGAYIPSLQEIASYNLSAPNVSTINPNSMQQNQSYAGNNSVQQSQMMQPMVNNNQQFTGNEQILPSQVLPSTPATSIDYGATMGTAVREDLGMGITDFANPYPNK